MEKRTIIAQIKRTAEANGGVPLGKQRFASETGIKETDWSGRYWATWGDAIREAGFTPNELQGRLPDEQILESLARLVQELGKFPTIAELKLKCRREPAFPSHNVFRRFGRKPQLAARLIEFASSRPEFGDIEAHCKHFVGQPTESSEESLSPEPDPELGYVYLIRAGRFFKIGRTNAVGRRERELAIQLPEKTRTVHTITTDDPAGIEAYWHQRFADRRKNGEWFELTSQDVRAFKRRRFM